MKYEKPKAETLQLFIDKHGYDVVKKRESGTWKGIAQAAKQTGLSEYTVRAVLEFNPTEPHKGQPKYVSEFESDENLGWKLYKQKYGHKKRHIERARSILMEAWLFLDHKDLADWTEQDYHKIWFESRFYQAEFRGQRFEGVHEGYATIFHNLMKLTKKSHLLEMFQGKKYPSGEKKEWYLTKDDIIALSREYQDNENVLMLALGISVGGRWSSLVETVPEKMNFAEKRISMYETKRQHWVTRRLLKPLIPLLKDYIADYHIGATEPLFTQSYGWYAVKMSEAGRRAKLRLHVSTHILKHTFVSQALKHGVSAEIIVAQTGTDWETLKKHYTAEDEAKGDHELQGEKYDVQPFPEWYAELMPFFRAAYERIKSEGISNGFRARLIEPEQSI